MGGPHGLFKRSGQEDSEQWEHIPIGTRGWWGLSGPHGLFKKSGDREPIKRGAYSFGKILSRVGQKFTVMFCNKICEIFQVLEKEQVDSIVLVSASVVLNIVLVLAK